MSEDEGKVLFSEYQLGGKLSSCQMKLQHFVALKLILNFPQLLFQQVRQESSVCKFTFLNAVFVLQVLLNIFLYSAVRKSYGNVELCATAGRT